MLVLTLVIILLCLIFRQINQSISQSYYSASSRLFAPSTSKELIVHSVFFDERSYRKGHTNITMIFLTIEKRIYLSNWITSCGAGLTASNNFIVRPTYQHTHRLQEQNAKFEYEQYVIECYDLFIVNGSKVFVRYRNANDTPEVVVESEVIIPAPRVQPTGKYNFTVATCTKAFNRKINYLPEFVRYQKTIGVDHVHLSVLDEFMRDGGFRNIVLKDDFMKKSLSNGYLSISVLDLWYEEEETYLYSSVYQRLGCFYQLRGTYDYISIADTDDFFTPRIPGITDMKYYIQKYCIDEIPNAGSCRFQWRWLFPDVCGTTGEIGPDGNVTKTVNVPAVEEYHRNSKSIHSSKAVVDFTFHDAKGPGCMLPEYRVVEIPPDIVYFAHNRLGAKHKFAKTCFKLKEKARSKTTMH